MTPKSITKHGDGFFSIGPVMYQGHSDDAGRALVAPSEHVHFAFRKPLDGDGINLDPIDVLSVLSAHLGPDTPAGRLMAEAVEILEGTAAVPVTKHIGQPVTDLRKKPGPKPKVKQQTEEAA